MNITSLVFVITLLNLCLLTQQRRKECFTKAHNRISAMFGNRMVSKIGCRPKPVNGRWGRWRPWSVCSKTCGGGTQTATRLCNAPAPSNNGINCFEKSQIEVSCNTFDCKSDFQSPTKIPPIENVEAIGQLN